MRIHQVGGPPLSRTRMQKWCIPEMLNSWVVGCVGSRKHTCPVRAARELVQGFPAAAQLPISMRSAADFAIPLFKKALFNEVPAQGGALHALLTLHATPRCWHSAFPSVVASRLAPMGRRWMPIRWRSWPAPALWLTPFRPLSPRRRLCPCMAASSCMLWRAW